MQVKKYSFKQLFSLVDGRLSTSMDDVYDMLNFITGEDLMTHHLPVAMAFIKSNQQKWYKEVQKDIDALPVDLVNDDFNTVMCSFPNKKYEVQSFTDEEKEELGFESFMINNSLLKQVNKRS